MKPAGHFGVIGMVYIQYIEGDSTTTKAEGGLLVQDPGAPESPAGFKRNTKKQVEILRNPYENP